MSKVSMRNIVKRVLGILTTLAVVSVSFVIPVNAEPEEDDYKYDVMIDVPSSWEAGKFDVQVDGVPVSYGDTDTANRYKLQVDEDSVFVTAFLYNGDVSDPSNFPQHMRVYEIGRDKVENEGSWSEEKQEYIYEYDYAYSAKHIEALDDVLEYVGFSIRAESKTKKSGLRFSSSIPTKVKTDGVATDKYEYTVKEYGNIHIYSSDWTDDSRNNMTFKNSVAHAGKCYVRGTKQDAVIRIKDEGTDRERLVFANALTDIKDFNVSKNFRSYLKLTRKAKDTREAGDEVVLYGPAAGRSPYYIANKLVTRGTEKDKGILKYSNMIINTVEGNSSATGNSTENTNKNESGNNNSGNTNTNENGGTNTGNTNSNENNNTNTGNTNTNENSNTNTGNTNTNENGNTNTGNTNTNENNNTNTGNTNENGGTNTGTTPSNDPVNALFIGDSVMMGTVLRADRPQGRGLERDLSYDYSETGCTSQLISSALANKLNKSVECKLVANGGATYSKEGSNGRYMELLAGSAIGEYGVEQKSPDYIFLLAGVNDWVYRNQQQGPNKDTAVFGDPDTSTSSQRSYCGDIYKTLELITGQYPNAQVVVCSPLRAWMYSGYGSDTVNESTQKTLKQYSQAQGAIVAKLKAAGKKVNFVNLYDKILTATGLPDHEPYTTKEIEDYLKWFPDGYHPSRATYEKVRDIVIKDMESFGLF